jgi:hypothetical protein
LVDDHFSGRTHGISGRYLFFRRGATYKKKEEEKEEVLFHRAKSKSFYRPGVAQRATLIYKKKGQL